MALAVLVSVFFFSGAPAVASDCDSVVLDTAQLFGDDLKKVENAANELIKAGANVRVVTSKNYTSEASTLDDFKGRLQARCPSWRSADGGMRNNLIVFMIDRENRDVGVYYGDEWVQAFQNNAVAHINSNIMGPRFRDGDFAGGFANGISYVETLVRSQLTPSTSRAPTTVIHQEAADNSGFISVLWVLVLLGAAGALLVFGMRFMQARRTAREQLEAALQKAQMAKTSCATAINSYDTAVLEAKIHAVKQLISDDDFNALKRELDAVQRSHAARSAEFSELETVAGSDLNSGDQSKEAYATIGNKYEQLQKEFATIRRSLTDLESKAESVKALAADAPKKIAETEAAITAAKASIATVQGKGFRVDEAEKLLTAISTLFAEATKLQSEKRSAAATKMAQSAREKAAAAIQSAEEQPLIKERIDRGIAQAKQSLETSAKRMNGIYQLFTRISEKYAVHLWKPIQGNGTEAENYHDKADEALEQAALHASLEKQDWSLASKQITNANLAIEEAESLLSAIASLGKNLEEAERKAEPEIAAAQSDIKRAWDFIRTHDADVADSLEGTLQRVEQALQGAREELKKEKPDYIAAYKAALKANADADKILAAAEDEHQRAVRKRKQADDLKAEAARSIDVAARYIDNHRSVVGNRARQLLANAQETLGSIRSKADIDAYISVAEQADNYADSALQAAQNDVEEEEERIREAQRAHDRAVAAERARANELAEASARRAREQRSSSFPSSSFPSSSPASSSWGTRSTPSRSSGSGSSISFGGSSSGRGGSSSIGRSSSGRGGSSKW